MATESIVSFRGTKSGLVVLFNDGVDFDELIISLGKKLDDSGYFFVGAPVTLDSGQFDFSKNQLLQIRDLLRGGHGLDIKSIKTKSELTQKNAIELSWDVIKIREEQSSTGVPDPTAPPPQFSKGMQQVSDNKNLPTHIHKHSLRSGQFLEYDGNIVILGDVNPGAEVIASGDIIIFGTLRGMAFAGAGGDERSIILALRFNPTQIRIADKLARSDESTEAPHFPEFAAIEKDRIIIEPWSKKSI